jgi:hypothetical protein
LGEIKKSYITNKDIVQRADNAGYDLTKFVNSLTKTKKKSGIKV